MKVQSSEVRLEIPPFPSIPFAVTFSPWLRVFSRAEVVCDIGGRYDIPN